MSRLVFICPYRKPGNGPRRQNLIRYMATREGVQLTDSMDADLPATDKQRTLIQKLVKEMPETADLMEYEDFQRLPTRSAGRCGVWTVGTVWQLCGNSGVGFKGQHPVVSVLRRNYRRQDKNKFFAEFGMPHKQFKLG